MKYNCLLGMMLHILSHQYLFIIFSPKYKGLSQWTSRGVTSQALGSKTSSMKPKEQNKLLNGWYKPTVSTIPFPKLGRTREAAAAAQPCPSTQGGGPPGWTKVCNVPLHASTQWHELWHREDAPAESCRHQRGPHSHEKQPPPPRAAKRRAQSVRPRFQETGLATLCSRNQGVSSTGAPSRRPPGQSG